MNEGMTITIILIVLIVLWTVAGCFGHWFEYRMALLLINRYEAKKKLELNCKIQSLNRVHVIPVGGSEPAHVCGTECWCNPLLSEGGVLVTHHAKDCREKNERQGIEDPDKLWVNVWEAKT